MCKRARKLTCEACSSKAIIQTAQYIFNHLHRIEQAKINEENPKKIKLTEF